MPSFASTEPLYERSSPTIKFSFAISSPNHFGKSATIACRDADYVKRIANLPDTQEQLVSYVYKEAVSPRLAARKESNRVEITKVKADFEAATKRHEFIFAEDSGARLH